MNHSAVIGFGCAGYHAVKAMREEGYEGEIHVFHQHLEPPANPMLTTYYVAGKLPRTSLFPFGSLEEIQKQYNLTLHMGTEVTAVDYDQKVLHIGEKMVFSYDQLLLATGASAMVPGFPGCDSPCVFCMRTVEDADRLAHILATLPIRKAVVVGASMVGIKVAELLLDKGISCTLADLSEQIFPVAALPEVAKKIQQRVAEAGIVLRLGHSIAAISKEPQGYRVHYQNGATQMCDLVVLCIGTRPNTGLAGNTLGVERGIVVNDRMETSCPGVYAAGDCCEGANLQSSSTQIIGLWANAALQGRTAGRNMAGRRANYGGSIPHNITHFLNMDFIGIGYNKLEGEHIGWASDDGSTALRLVVEDGQMKCVNILENYRISGILKSYFLKRLSGVREPLSITQRTRLGQLGIPGWLIHQISQWDIVQIGRDVYAGNI